MAAAKANVYEMVTTRIIEELEKGIIPWEKPWTGIRAGAYNRVSKKPYSMINRVVVPMKEQYKAINEYYSTTFHELTHSTGHKNRLNRLQTGAVAAFGGEEYSKEELVAEIGSASLMNMLGIETTKTFRNSAAYIQSWVKVLKNDNKFIVSAAGKAEKAVNYILAAE